MGKYDDRPYQVGKGKPPVANRWVKGQSGNSRGPKRRVQADMATMRELLAEIINAPIEVTITDPKTKKERIVSMSLREAILRGLTLDAVGGSPQQRLKAFYALNSVGAFDLLPADKQLTPDQWNEKVNAFLEDLAGACEEQGIIEKDPQGTPCTPWRMVER